MRNHVSLLLAILCLVPAVCSGCATIGSSEREQLLLEPAYNTFDLSKSSQTGTLEIHCVPPFQQIFIYHYMIKIDDYEPLKVLKHSYVTMKLDAGAHQVELWSIPHTLKSIYGDMFGKKLKTTVDIISGQSISYQYIGSADIFSKGKLVKK